ncbi:MAG: asparagine synthetase B, partial [Salibacteraceae bacterium]|nr:asparagine synthetase B [Salibacteraceae bacterium]
MIQKHLFKNLLQTTFLFFCVFLTFSAEAKKLLVPMDESQRDHLKAYGIAYWSLEKEVEVQWLLNYR